MSEINKIFPQSSLKIEKGYSNTLCFIDGLIIDKSKYALENNQISIYQKSEKYLSLFYNLNNSRTYYFEKNLNNYGTIISGEDEIGYKLQRLVNNNIIVFVDGILLRKDEYSIIDSGSLTILLKMNDEKLHQIVIYVSNTPLTYGTLQYVNVPDNMGTHERAMYEQNKIGYDKRYTLIFRNGKLIDAPLINNIVDDNDKYVKINIDKGPNDIIEYYQLNKSTISYNFQTTFGVMVYGPIDDYAITIPVLHDSYAVFDELAKISIDNIRPGFIIRENNSGGRAIVVDTDFDKPRIKTLTLQEFSTNYYTSGEYYVEVPEAKSIIDYMSDYDQKYSYFPEILRIFQRLLLDEIHDEVARLRAIRNIHEIDNKNVNKLINLLGLDLDIKHLNDKQRREALEELTNFFRIAGTKDSYNYFNVIQDSAKITSIKQLFTYHKNQIKQETNRTYIYTASNGSTPNGSGYFVGEKYRLIDIFSEETPTPLDITATITEVDSNGAITSFSIDTPQGNKNIYTENYPLETVAQGARMNCYSTPIQWRCDITLGGNQSQYVPGNILETTEFPQRIEVEAVDAGGAITQYTPTTINSDTPYDLTNVPLTTDIGNLKIKINKELISEELVFEKTTAGTFTFTPSDPKAEYRFEMSGGGGSGGAADSDIRSQYDIEAAGGSRGEFKNGTFQCTAGTPITIYVGGGGQPSYAQGSTNTSPTTGDAGQGYGTAAQRGVTRTTVARKNNTSIPVDLRSYSGFWIDGHNTSDLNHLRGIVNSASGSGGGASAIVINNNPVSNGVARGGNGGTADYAGTIKRIKSGTMIGNLPILYKPTLAGGTGGNGGGVFADTRGAAGGGRNNDGTFRSKAGANGYVRIWKRKFRYVPILINNSGLPYHDGDVISTPNDEFIVTINHIYNGSILPYSDGGYVLTPSEGYYPYGGTEFPLYRNSGGATLTVRSTPIRWRYNVTLSGQQSGYFTNPPDNTRYLYDGPEGGIHNFTVTLNSVNNGVINNFSYSPMEGDRDINFNDRQTWVTHGVNGTIRIQSSTDQIIQNTEREYVDFYLPEEVGGIWHLDYRFPTIDYGSVAQGSTNSPDPQVPGLPDIDYGSVAQLYPDNYIDYGYVSEKIQGEWVEWLEWERPKDLYPTNHVEIEAVILSYEKYDSAIARVYKQFYELASAVLYIHNLISVFSFGNYGQASQTDGDNPNGNERILMGIMTAPVQSYDIHCLTSDPRQDNI